VGHGPSLPLRETMVANGSQGEIHTETLPGAWDLSGRARRAYAERISLDLRAEI